MPDEPSVGGDRAVVDRIVDGTTAVLLIGESQTELTIPAKHLPDGAADGTWLILDYEAMIAGIDQQLTVQRQTMLEDRLSRIRQERAGGRFNH